jgi:oligosaccharide repeat unit polymerase
MLDLILILNAGVAIVGGLVLFRATRNYIVWFFEFVFVLFFVVRPLSIPLLGSIRLVVNDYAVVYGICGLIFAVVFHFTVYKLFVRERLFSDYFFRFCDFDYLNNRRFVVAVSGFALLTYLANIFRLGSYTYFMSGHDAFAAKQRMAGGTWFVEALSQIVIFALIAVLAKNIEARPARLWCLCFLSVMVVLVFSQPASRTGTIAIVLAVAVYAVSKAKSHRWLLIVAPLVAVTIAWSLLTLNALRTGGGLQNLTELDYSVVNLATTQLDLVPTDDGIALVEYFRTHHWLYFRYLLPSLVPVNVIPSIIFPYKPDPNVDRALTYNIFGINPDPQFHAGSILTFTVPGAGYADLWYFGVVIAAVIYGFLFSFLLRGWKSGSPSVRFITLWWLITIIAELRVSVEDCMNGLYVFLLAMWLLHTASYFMSPSSVMVGPELVRDEKYGSLSTNQVFVFCVVVTICILCLFAYALAGA